MGYTKNIFKKKSLMPAVLVIGIFLAAGSAAVTYASLSSSGKLFFHKANKESEYNTDVSFILDDSVRVDTDNIKGEVLQCGPVIAEQVENDDIFSSQSPYVVEKSFPGISAAIAYVGYDGLKWPALEEKILNANLSVCGNDKGEITQISLTTEYDVSQEINAQTEAKIYTDKYVGEIGTGVTSYSDDFAGVDYSGKAVHANGREFWVVSSSNFDHDWMNKIVYWQENYVIYTLFIRYKEVDEKTVTNLVNRWMKGF